MALVGVEMVTICSCSTGLAVIFIPVLLWGIVSNILILLILCRSRMIKENTGKILANEAVCDIFINCVAGAMATANFFNRRIAAIGVPVITSLSCVRAYCLLGVSLVLYFGICHSLKYRIYVHTRSIIAFLIFAWSFVPTVLLIIYLEGTFFSRKAPSEFVQPDYTSPNWWVGAFITVNAGIFPLLGIIYCFYKTLSYQHTKICPNSYTNSSSVVKIRLAKMSMVIFLLHVLSQLPSHVVSGLHLISPAAVGTGYMLIFLYPSCKWFIFYYMLRYFRKTTKEMLCRCCCKKGAMGVTSNQSTVSILAVSKNNMQVSGVSKDRVEPQ